MVELLISSAIIVSAFLVAAGVAQKSLQVSRQAVHSAQASFLLEEGSEASRIVRDNSWTTFSALTNGTVYYPTYSGGTWTLSTTPNQVDSFFTRTVTLSAVYRDGNDDIASSGTLDSDIKKITVSVSWQEGSTTLTKTISFYLTNLFS